MTQDQKEQRLKQMMAAAEERESRIRSEIESESALRKKEEKEYLNREVREDGDQPSFLR